MRLRNLIAAMILDGDYGEGEQLPSVRAFAQAHGANPLTVAKAYQSLQDRDYVTVRRGVGMFVADGAVERLRREARAEFLGEQWPRIRAHVERLGLGANELFGRVSA